MPAKNYEQIDWSSIEWAVNYEAGSMSARNGDQILTVRVRRNTFQIIVFDRHSMTTIECDHKQIKETLERTSRKVFINSEDIQSPSSQANQAVNQNFLNALEVLMTPSSRKSTK